MDENSITKLYNCIIVRKLTSNEPELLRSRFLGASQHNLLFIVRIIQPIPPAGRWNCRARIQTVIPKNTELINSVATVKQSIKRHIKLSSWINRMGRRLSPRVIHECDVTGDESYQRPITKVYDCLIFTRSKCRRIRLLWVSTAKAVWKLYSVYSSVEPANIE